MNEPQETRRRRCAEISRTRDGRVMITMRGSSFGGCTHSHIAALRGLEEAAPPAFLQSIFQRGHLAEAWSKDELKRRGVRMIEDASGFGNQSQLVLFDDLPDGRLLRLAISPDGLAMNRDGTLRALEVKSFSVDSYAEFCAGWEKNTRYAYQISAVVHGYRKRERRSDIGGAIVPVVCKKDADEECGWAFQLGDIVKFDEPPFTRDEVIARCLRHIAAFDAGEWPKCDSKYGCRYDHNPPLVSLPEEAAIAARYEAALAEYDAAKLELEYACVGRVALDAREFSRGLEQVVRFQ